jgi:hypothetical protein
VKKPATKVSRKDEPPIRGVGCMYQRQPGVGVHPFSHRHGIDLQFVIQHDLDYIGR